MYQDALEMGIFHRLDYTSEISTSEIINRCIESTYQKQRTPYFFSNHVLPNFYLLQKCCMPTSTPPDLHPAIKVPKMNGWRFIGVDILLNSALNAISHETVSMYCRIYLGSLFVLLSIIIFFIIIWIIYKIYFVNKQQQQQLYEDY